MTHDEKEIKRKPRIQKYAEYCGNIAKTCRYYLKFFRQYSYKLFNSYAG